MEIVAPPAEIWLDLLGVSRNRSPRVRACYAPASSRVVETRRARTADCACADSRFSAKQTHRKQEDRGRRQINSMEVTVRAHWRRRSRIPAPRPSGLRRSVDARAGRTRCERSGHRRSAPGLHASLATDSAVALCWFAQPAHRRVRRQGRVPPVGSRLPVRAARAPGVDAGLRASVPRRS